MKNLFTFLAILFTMPLFAQVYTDPAFPTVDDAVTLYYDATQGSAGLKDCNCDVYIHTGVITNLSSSGSDWKHVKMTWGVANPDWKLTPVAGKPNLYKYTFTPTVKDYYVPSAGEAIQKLAFVFRNANGDKEGKGTNGTDMYITMYGSNAGLETLIQYPTSSALTSKIGDVINFKGSSSKTADLTLTDNGDILKTANGKDLSYQINVTTAGFHTVKFRAEVNGEVSEKSFTYFIPNGTTIENPPTGTKLGATYLANGDIRFLLNAPLKSNCFLIGSFNNWTQSSTYQMKRSVDGNYYWIDLKGLAAGQIHTYQYLVDGYQNIADPLSDLILDPGNDKNIPAATYPNMPVYPVGTSGAVSVLQPGKTPYVWTTKNYVRPASKDLVIYELLIRDFSPKRSFQSVIDSLDYLKRLGINAIELMPVHEFENNNSWGYNPSYHNALDKSYGTQDKFKELVDKAHGLGIAIITDVVFNHAFSQSPLYKLYNEFGKPSGDSPYLNTDATHPFNVGYDFNHESKSTKDYVKRCLEYWLVEYKIDGYRFDLSKGFTQTKNTDVGKWSAYDASRIAILKDYYDFQQTVSKNSYSILEHLGENTEEKELGNYGMMLWAKMTDQYNEGSMGFGNNSLIAGYYKNRGFTKPQLVTFQESHDEERLMYKNYTFGNTSNPNYNIRDYKIANSRNELTACFFYPIPGPKMIWQFGELGYDYSINACQNGNISNNCRTDQKPIRWDYYQETSKRRLYNVTASIINLKRQYPDLELVASKLQGYFKYIKLQGNGINMIVIGNFENADRIDEGDTVDEWTEQGTYFEYFTGNTYTVGSNIPEFNLKAGEYRIYTDKKLAAPIGGFVKYILLENNEVNVSKYKVEVYPNPTDMETVQLSFDANITNDVKVEITDISGKIISSKTINATNGANLLNIAMPNSAGTYFVKLYIDGETISKKVVKI